MKKIFYLLLILIYTCTLVQAQSSSVLDSLQAQLKYHPVTDTIRVLILLQLHKECIKAQPDAGLEHARMALRLAERLKYTTGVVKALNAIGTVYNMRGDYPRAIEHFLKVTRLGEAIGNKKIAAVAQNNIGEIYRKQGDYLQALDYHLKSLRLKEQLGDKKGIANSLNNLGLLYSNQKNYDMALEYHSSALVLRREVQDKPGIAASLNNIGEVYKEQKNYIKALEYYLKSLELDQELGNSEGMAISYNNMGEINERQKKYLDALQYFHKGLQIQQDRGDQHGVAISANNIARVYTLLGDFDEALKYGMQSLEVAQKIGAKPDIQQAYQQLHVMYARMNMPDRAYHYQSLYVSMRDSLFNEESSRRLVELQNTYESEKKQAQIVLLTKEKELRELALKRQEMVHRGLVLGFVLVFALVFVLHRGNVQKRRANLLLLMQKDEIQRQAESLQLANAEITLQRDAIQQQRNLIEKKNEDIEGSIRYARRIQTAILPSRERISKVFPLHFILFKPRNIVSGDFYWFAEVRNEDLGIHERPDKVVKAIVAVVDCTGHGVPGAFMSMIGDSLLNHIVIDRRITEPELILDEMHKGIRKALHQEECENRDGMDMALCVVDFERKTLEFAGANNPIIVVQDQKLEDIRGDRNSIGGMQREEERHFTRQTISLTTPTTLYMFSDGYQDQFGGEHNRKFTSRRMKDLLCDLHQYDMDMQRQLLDETIEAWKGKNYQIDDILVMGIRL